jgi:hypothetical protein
VEINTRRSGGRAGRETDLIESLAFARLHYAAALDPGADVAGSQERAQ